MLLYSALEGQSIFDICLQTYGSLDFLVKLLQDNQIPSISIAPVSGQVFTWDETLTVDQVVNQTSQNSNIIYATKAIPNDFMNTIINNGGDLNIPSGSGGILNNTNPALSSLSMYIGAVIDPVPSIAIIQALTVLPAAKGMQTYTYTEDTMRFCFAYPTSLGVVSSVKDTNGFEIKSAFTINVLNFTINGSAVSYTTMVLSRPTTQNNFNVTFTL